jgi:hypothetical protein
MITKYSIEKLKSEFERLGYQWLPFMVVGIRSAANLNNKFDDLIGLVNNNTITWFSGTTNAGRHWLLNFLNPKGTAMLKAGQYINCYELGYHKGQYLALVQTGGKVTVYRDADKDEIAEEQGILDTGWFGINIHHANAKAISSIVDKWSGGCQVLNNPEEFSQLIKACQRSGLKAFSYTLLKEF